MCPYSQIKMLELDDTVIYLSDILYVITGGIINNIMHEIGMISNVKKNDQKNGKIPSSSEG